MSKSRNGFRSLMRRSKLGERYLDDQDFRIWLTASFSFAFNLIYALYNHILGALSGEIWFTVMSGYYMILGAMRLGVVYARKKIDITKETNGISENELSIMNFCGILLIVLAFEFAASAYLSFVFDIAAEYDTLIMISVSVYTAIRMVFAVKNMIRAHKKRSPLLSIMRDISCADAAASVFALLRSILICYVTVQNLMSTIYARFTLVFAVFTILFVFGLGANLLIKVKRHRRADQAKESEK